MFKKGLMKLLSSPLKVILLVVLLNIVSSFLRIKSNQEKEEFISSHNLELKNSRIGPIDNISRRLDKPRFQFELAKIKSNFPFNPREPVLKNPEATSNISEIKQTPVPIDSEFKSIVNSVFNSKRDQTNYNSREFIKSDEINPIQSEEMKKVVAVFLDDLNFWTKNQNWVFDFIEDQTYEISSTSNSNSNKNLNSTVIKYSLVVFIYETSSLISRGINLVATITNPISGVNIQPLITKDTIKYLDLKPVVQKSDSSTSGPKTISSVPDYSNFISGESGLNPNPGDPRITSTQKGSAVSSLLNTPLWFELGKARQPRGESYSPFLQEGFGSELESESNSRFNFVRPEVKICYKDDGSIETGLFKDPKDCNGALDTPVRSSSDCPFYKKNKNYLNDFGGVNKQGFCQMPEGVTRLGFRFYNGEPTCHNCLDLKNGSKKKGKCCKEQEEDPVTYKTLITPDFAFEGDSPIRNIRKSQLNTLSLTV